MEPIFQQAKFDEKLDERRLREVYDQIHERLKNNPLSVSHVCDRCGRRGLGITNVVEGTFTCEVCLTIDEIDKRYK